MNRKLESVGEQAVSAEPVVLASKRHGSLSRCIGFWTKATLKVDHQC